MRKLTAFFRNLFKEVLEEVREEKQKQLDYGVLARESLALVEAADLKVASDMSKREQEEFFRKAHDLYNNPATIRIFASLVEEQKDKTLGEGRNEDQLLAGQVAIGAFKTFYERIESLASEFEALSQPDSFDKEAIIQE